MLRDGLSLGILVGGEREQLLSQRQQHDVVLRDRKGVVKLALQFGVSLVGLVFFCNPTNFFKVRSIVLKVPCYCFGETDLYGHSNLFIRARQWLVILVCHCVDRIMNRLRRSESLGLRLLLHLDRI